MLVFGIVFLPFLFAAAGWVLGRAEEVSPAAGIRRDIFVIAACGAELVMVLLLPGSLSGLSIPGVLTGELTFTVDGFRKVYATVTAVMWFFTSLFAKEYFHEERENLNRYWFFVIVTLGATEGVMLSGDLMTSFVFFEILSFTSFTWVIHEETEEAVRAGFTYLFIAVIGGLVLFMGLAMLLHTAGTLSFSELPLAVQTADPEMVFAAGVCILFGFGAKAGMFPLHVWLPKAHPVAPSPASALLSGILTKVGVYGILMTSLEVLSSSGTFAALILSLGLVTMFLGAVLALFSVNLKRTLACSSMSQIGFILTGIAMTIFHTAMGEGEGRALALSGAMLHMLNHSMIKLTLFMAAGTVVMNLHALSLDEIRGWGRNKHFLKAAFALGALGISGVPLFNGYLSKTMLHEGIVEGIHHSAELSGFLRCAEWIFLFSGGITFCYMLKLFIAVFVEKNLDPEKQARYDASSYCMNGWSTFAVFGSSLVMPVLGQPAVMTRIGAFMTGDEEILHFHAFTWANLKGGLISLGIGAALYLLVVRRLLMRNGSYVNLWPARLDLENALYRPVLVWVLPEVFGRIAAVVEGAFRNPLLAWIVPETFGRIAGVFGENVVLSPFGREAAGIPAKPGTEEDTVFSAAARVNHLVLSFLGRLVVDGMDAFIWLLRMTLVKETRVEGYDVQKKGKLWVFRTETAEAARPISDSFTSALMMTCIGILFILGALVYCLAAV